MRSPLARHRFAFALLLVGCLFGCAAQEQWVTVRSTPSNPLASTLDLVNPRGPKPSERTTLLLRRYDLESAFPHRVDHAIEQLDSFATTDTRHEHEHAMAELAYLAAQREEDSNAQLALDHYGTAVLHAYQFLFDDTDGQACNPYDPQFRGACDLYNQSLEGLLRLVRKEGDLRPGQRREIRTTSHVCSFDIVSTSHGWHAEDFGEMEFVSDYQVSGLRNHYRTYGLGVPLIVKRQAHGEEDPAERYYPSGLTFPITAFLRINNLHANNPRSPEYGAGGPSFVLELHDPLEKQSFTVAGRKAPMESDLSVPLAHFLNSPAASENQIATLGLFKPDKVKDLQGLYMLEPFDPNKMPVLMVHGLYSSPATWMEMFNDLRSDPQIRDRYQFWFYLYPTGQPFWISATQLRNDLAVMRNQLDPTQRQAALDQMVLVGHSMGGLVSKLQSVDSGHEFWRINTEREFQQLQANSELKQQLAGAYFFRPNTSIRRVVTIGTPHRGSRFANSFTQWVGKKLIRAPLRIMQGRQELLANNPGYFRSPSAFDIRTSIDSLAPTSPLLPVLLTAQPAPWVDYHNIVGQLPNEGLHKFLGEEGDGVVSIDSARLDEMPRLASQIFVPSDHVSVHRHSQSVFEVRRILLAQLKELQELPYGGSNRIQLATRHTDTESK